MPAHPSPRVQEVSEVIAGHMDAILALFKPGKKITVLVRDPETPDHSRDFCLMNDSPDDAIKALERRKLNEGTLRGDV